MARAEAQLHAKFHLHPTNRLATVHERYRQTDRQDRQRGQRIDSIGRTVLQMVAQKTKVLIIFYSAASGSIKQNLAICVTILKQHCNIYSKNSNTAVLTILR